MSKILRLLNKAKHQNDEKKAADVKKDVHLIADEESVSQKMRNSARTIKQVDQRPLLILIVLMAAMSAGSFIISLNAVSAARKDNAASFNLVNGYIDEKNKIKSDIEYLNQSIQINHERINNEINNLINHTGLNEKIIEEAVSSNNALKTSFEELKSTDRLLLDKYILLKQRISNVEQKSQDQGRKE